jgi:large subunit ribosomal protein L21
MYAVIRVGTSQERVTEGQVVRVDLRSEEPDTEISFVPVLLVDGDNVVAGPALKGATVTAKVLDHDARGPKIRALTYKAKSIQRRRWGHRQHYSNVEITKISPKA